jgi:hypothetical protein
MSEILGGVGFIGLGIVTIYSSRAASPWSRVWFLRLIEVPGWYERLLLVAPGAPFAPAGLPAPYRGLSAA